MRKSELGVIGAIIGVIVVSLVIVVSPLQNNNQYIANVISFPDFYTKTQDYYVTRIGPIPAINENDYLLSILFFGNNKFCNLFPGKKHSAEDGPHSWTAKGGNHVDPSTTGKPPRDRIQLRRVRPESGASLRDRGRCRGVRGSPAELRVPVLRRRQH